MLAEAAWAEAQALEEEAARGEGREAGEEGQEEAFPKVDLLAPQAVVVVHKYLILAKAVHNYMTRKQM